MAKRRETNSRTISSKRWYKQAQNAYLSLSLSLSLERTDTQGDNTRRQNKEEEKKQLKKEIGTKSAVRIQIRKKNPKRDVIGWFLLVMAWRDIQGRVRFFLEF